VKSITDVPGLRSIKSMHSTSKRSIPRVQSSAYLDLYILRKERDRLEREESLLEKRKKEIQKKVKEIEQQMELLQRSAQEQSPDQRNQGVDVQAEKGWKKMTLNY
jgi:hypothetical protein